MSDALACDGPACETTGVYPYMNWCRLEFLGLVVATETGERADFCCWDCLLNWVAEAGETVREFERRTSGD